MTKQPAIWGVVAALLCGSAEAQVSFTLPDPRVGTHACVVENAFVLDPATGESGRWSNHQKSFIVHVSTCSQALAPGFAVNFGRLAKESRAVATASVVQQCQNPFPHMLVLTTTLRGDEMGWGTATAALVDAADGAALKTAGGIFRNHSQSVAGTVGSTLALRSDLSFDLVKGDTATAGGGMKWWTMNGHCTPFDPDQ